MYGGRLSRTFEYVEQAGHSRRKGFPMHGSLHLILATESDRSRRAEASRNRLARTARRGRPFARLAERVVVAHGIPPRAAPGTDLPLGHSGAASLRAR